MRQCKCQTRYHQQAAGRRQKNENRMREKNTSKVVAWKMKLYDMPVDAVDDIKKYILKLLKFPRNDLCVMLPGKINLFRALKFFIITNTDKMNVCVFFVYDSLGPMRREKQLAASSNY